MFSIAGTPFSDFNTAYPNAVWESFRTSIPNALDGVGGGAYTLGSTLTIGGTGPVTIDAPTTLEDVTALTMSGSAKITTTTPRTVDRVVDATWYFTTDGTVTNYLVSVSGGALTVDELTDPFIGCALHLPNGCVLNSIELLYHPPSGHGGTPTMPVLTVYKQFVNVSGTPGPISIGSVTDTIGGSYETEHTIIVSGLNETVVRGSYRYFVGLQTERSTNSIAGTTVYQLTANYTTSSYDEGQ